MQYVVGDIGRALTPADASNPLGSYFSSDVKSLFKDVSKQKPTKTPRTLLGESSESVEELNGKKKKSTKRKRQPLQEQTAAPEDEVVSKSDNSSSAKKKKVKQQKKDEGEPVAELPSEEHSDTVSRKKKKKKKKQKEGSEGDIFEAKPADEDLPSAAEEEQEVAESDPGSDAKDDSVDRNARTVFVGNLPLTVTLKDLKGVFGKFGPIESVRFRSFAAENPKMPKRAVFITKSYGETKDNLNAYVVFATAESASSALQLNGQVTFGKHLRVDLATSKNSSAGDPRRSVFLGNLPRETREEWIWDAFGECGVVENVRLVRDKSTFLVKGFGFVTFKHQPSVKAALGLHNTDFHGRPLRVFRAVDTDKAKTISVKRGKGPSSNWHGQQVDQPSGAALRLEKKLRAKAKLRKQHQGKASRKLKKR